MITHVPAVGLARQPGGQFDQIGAAHMQHGRHQNRQLIPLRLALLWQPLRQLRFDAFRPNHDPVHLCHGTIPRQSELGIVASHPASTRHNKKLMDGEVTFPISVQRIDISEISYTCAAADVPITGYSHAGIWPLATACLTD